MENSVDQKTVLLLEDFKVRDMERLEAMKKKYDEFMDSMTPGDYFAFVKSSKNYIDSDEVKAIYANAELLLKKAIAAKQKNAQIKLINQLMVISAELNLTKHGINTFVYYDDLKMYVEKISGKCVKFTNIASYERDIPSDIIDKIAEVTDLFTDLYIVYTDYTDESAKKIDKRRREKDPILFGVVKNEYAISDRFYYLGDWIDENCDLTLQQMISDCKNNGEDDISRDIVIPKTQEEFKQLLDNMKTEKVKGEVPVKGKPGAKKAVTDLLRFIQGPKGAKKKFLDKIHKL